MNIQVGVRFQSFLVSLWLISHLQETETARAQKFVNSLGNDITCISDAIHEYVSSEYFITEEHLDKYYEAYHYVFKTLQVSMKDVHTRTQLYMAMAK